MPENKKAIMDTIVNTLLQIGDIVLEITNKTEITNVWYNKDMPNISEIAPQYQTVITQCASKIAKSFITRKNNTHQVTIRLPNNVYLAYYARIITTHPDMDCVFVVIERKAEENTSTDIPLQIWKQALDASSDGIWEINIETDTITFSDKWYSIFGYEPGEITKLTEWTAKYHPDDIPQIYNNNIKYRNGETETYKVELRCKCKDGSYKWVLSRSIAIAKNAEGVPIRYVGTHTDINERKIEQQKHAETSQFLFNILNNIQNGILVTDQYQNIIYTNQNFSKKYEDDTEPYLVGKSMWVRLDYSKKHHKDPEKFMARVAEIVNKKEKVIDEELELKDGRTFKRDFIPLFVNDEFKGEIWQFRDITRQKNAEKQIEEQRYFYESTLNNIPADIAVFDPQHTYLFVNKNGFKNPELRQWMIGKTDKDYAQYSNRPDSFYLNRYALCDKAAKDGKALRMIEPLVDKQGNTGYHLRILHPVYDTNGVFEFIVGYGMDVTELIVAQDALKTSVETFSAIFNQSGCGMALFALDGTFTDANTVICNMSGYTKEELLQLTHNAISYPEDVDIDDQQVIQLINKEISSYTIEKRFVSKDKKIVWVLLTVSLVWKKDETPNFFIAQVVDITTKKEMENELFRKNINLETTTTSLMNKIKQLEELNSIIAHNLRGPARNIDMLLKVILYKLKGNTNTAPNDMNDLFTLDEALELIAESSTSFIASLNTLMEIAEIKLNKEITYNDCNIKQVINEITKQLHGNIFEKNATLTLNLEVKQIRYPKIYLESILYNFISNALKYCKKNTPPEIVISSKQINEKIQLSVKDNGLGLDMKKYGNKIFMLNQVFHPGYDSKGIGLYITKTQVESLGGSIELISNVNEGSEFIVTI